KYRNLVWGTCFSSPFSCVNAPPLGCYGFTRPLRENPKGRANQALRCRLHYTFQEREQIGVNRIGLGGGHTVRKVLVAFERTVPQQLCRQRSGGDVRNDLIV